MNDYYLDLKKVMKIKNESDRTKIHTYYTDMLSYEFDGRDRIAKSLFNTLFNAGYLISIRDEKIENILSQNEV